MVVAESIFQLDVVCFEILSDSFSFVEVIWRVFDRKKFSCCKAGIIDATDIVRVNLLIMVFNLIQSVR